jgi:SAM-dependent methyltransferase
MTTLIPRMRSAIRYFGWADPFYKWRMSRSSCPSCAGRYFISLRPEPFMTRCLKCSSNVTNLSLIPTIKEHQKAKTIESCWEMSTYGATLSYLQRSFHTVVQSEYFQEFASGELVNGVLNQDVQNSSFPDSFFDLITCNQVFEHVPDDLKGYSECFRILKKGGALIFSVPLYDLPSTEMLAELVNGRIIFHAEPEYHDSRIAGPNSALTFWRHSVNDICVRVSKVGFRTKLVRTIIASSQRLPAQVIYAIKD